MAPPPGPVSWWPSWSSSPPLFTGRSPLPLPPFERPPPPLPRCLRRVGSRFVVVLSVFFFGLPYFGGGSSSQWLAPWESSSPRRTREETMEAASPCDPTATNTDPPAIDTPPQVGAPSGIFTSTAPVAASRAVRKPLMSAV